MDRRRKQQGDVHIQISKELTPGGMESELVPTEPGQTDPISAPTNNYIRKEDGY